MKFGIGTAQIKQKYGILKKKTNLKDLKSIFKKFNRKIDLIDTAPSYGLAEKFIGRYNNKNYKIVTKLNKIKKKKINGIIDEINLNLEHSLKNLKAKKIYCLMLHSEDDIKIFKEKKIKLFFEKLKKKKIISKIGISIYNMENLNHYLKIYNFDVVQIPLNIFTIRDNLIKYLKKLKKIYKFELHVRSIFFQGLIVENNKKIPKRFNYMKKKISLIKEISTLYRSTVYDVAISSVVNLKIANYIIIGISNYNEYLRMYKYKKVNLNKNLISNLVIKKSLTNLNKLK